jgi:hypothetical protein
MTTETPYGAMLSQISELEKRLATEVANRMKLEKKIEILSRIITAIPALVIDVETELQALDTPNKEEKEKYTVAYNDFEQLASKYYGYGWNTKFKDEFGVSSTQYWKKINRVPVKFMTRLEEKMRKQPNDRTTSTK